MWNTWHGTTTATCVFLQSGCEVGWVRSSLGGHAIWSCKCSVTYKLFFSWNSDIMSELHYTMEMLPRVKSTQVFILPIGNSVSITPHSISTSKVHSNDLVPPTPATAQSRDINLSHVDLSSYSNHPKLANGVLNLRFPVKASACQMDSPSDPIDFSDASISEVLTFSCAFCGQQLTKGKGG